MASHQLPADFFHICPIENWQGLDKSHAMATTLVRHNRESVRWPFRAASCHYGCRQVGAEQLGEFVGSDRFLEVIALSLRAILSLQS
jgi:hypothetical protein